ncbi:MAG: hypothetical protein WAX89_07275 [Alphaproteobacteria bacterium]
MPKRKKLKVCVCPHCGQDVNALPLPSPNADPYAKIGGPYSSLRADMREEETTNSRRRPRREEDDGMGSIFGRRFKDYD